MTSPNVACNSQLHIESNSIHVETSCPKRHVQTHPLTLQSHLVPAGIMQHSGQASQLFVFRSSTYKNKKTIKSVKSFTVSSLACFKQGSRRHPTGSSAESFGGICPLQRLSVGHLGAGVHTVAF